jgi:hypothetical protein
MRVDMSIFTFMTKLNCCFIPHSSGWHDNFKLVAPQILCVHIHDFKHVTPCVRIAEQWLIKGLIVATIAVSVCINMVINMVMNLL